MVRAIVIRTDGTNCDGETKRAIELAGAQADIVHLNSLARNYDPATGKNPKLDDFDLAVIAGGFSNGDYIASGKILACDLSHYLGDQLAKFVEAGKPIIGICNGFQVLVKYGLLPKFEGEIKQTTTLTFNDSPGYDESRRFRCDWIKLAKPKTAGDKCIWTKGIESIDLPIAHGEGRFVADKDVCKKLFDQGQVVFQYVDKSGNPTMKFPENPNGSMEAIAGICDPTGRIFGLMPHPERYNDPLNHPNAYLQKVLTKQSKLAEKNKKDLGEDVKKMVDEVGLLPEEGLGIQIFRNAVEYCK